MNWDTSDLRGQLFLIGAIALALTFVGITLLLNSAIFSDSIASRGPNTANTDVQQLNDSVSEYLASQVFVTNRNQTLSDSQIETRVQDSAAIWGNATARTYLDRGAVVSSEVTGTVQGTRVGQDVVRPYTDKDGDSNWYVLREPSGVNDYELELYVRSLDTGETFTVKSGPRNTSLVDQLIAANTEEVEITRTSSGTLEFDVETTSQTFTDRCTVEAPKGNDTTVIDLTDAEINGDECGPLERLEFDADESIRFNNGDAIEGEWSLSLDKEYSSNQSSDFTRPPANPMMPAPATTRSNYYNTRSDGQPYVDTEALYRVDYTVRYTQDDSQYTITGSVTPDANHLVIGQIIAAGSSGGSGGSSGSGGSGGSSGSGGSGGNSPPSVTIDSASASEVGRSGMYNTEVTFTPTDPDGNLDRAEVRYLDSSGSVIASDTVTGLSSGDSETVNERLNSEPSEIEVTVYDTDGASKTKTRSV